MRTKTLKERSRNAKFTLDLKDQSQRKIIYQLKGLCCPFQKAGMIQKKNYTSWLKKFKDRKQQIKDNLGKNIRYQGQTKIIRKHQ